MYMVRSNQLFWRLWSHYSSSSKQYLDHARPWVQNSCLMLSVQLPACMEGLQLWNHAAKTASNRLFHHQKWRLNLKQVLNNPPWEHLWKSRWTSALTCENMWKAQRLNPQITAIFIPHQNHGVIHCGPIAAISKAERNWPNSFNDQLVISQKHVSCINCHHIPILSLQYHFSNQSILNVAGILRFSTLN